jgi:hypothetical protein
VRVNAPDIPVIIAARRRGSGAGGEAGPVDGGVRRTWILSGGPTTRLKQATARRPDAGSPFGAGGGRRLSLLFSFVFRRRRLSPRPPVKVPDEYDVQGEQKNRRQSYPKK